METRILKLLGLLSSPSPVISGQAAQSLAESVIDVRSFLDQLEPFLLDKSWNTRVAAAKVLKHLANRDLQNDSQVEPESTQFCPDWTEFDLEAQLKLKVLLASSGDEFRKSSAEPLENKSVMWSTIDQQVGMDAKLLGLSSREWLTDEDVKTDENSDRSSPASTDESAAKRLKTEVKEEPQWVKDSHLPEAEFQRFINTWPYGVFWMKLQTVPLLFSPIWYQRHGSLLGLAEIVQMLAKKCKSDPTIQSQMDPVWLYLINSLLRLAARDRFSDFVGTQIVVPIRETTAQIVGIVAASASNVVLNRLLQYLRQFISTKDVPWECVHFALVCFKYIVGAVCGNLVEMRYRRQVVVGEFLPYTTRCLASSNEDILSAACTALLVVCEQISSEDAVEETALIVQLGTTAVIKCLARKDVDETVDSVSPSSDALESSLPLILELLGRIIKATGTTHVNILSDWKFLRGIFGCLDHPLDSVRQSAVAFMITFLDLDKKESLKWTKSLFSMDSNQGFERRITSSLQLLYRRLLTEGNDLVADKLTMLWSRLLDCASGVDQLIFVRSVCQLVGVWLSFLMVSEGSPKLDPTHLKMFDSEQYFSPSWDASSSQCIIGGDDFVSLPSDCQQRYELVTKIKMRVSKLVLAPILDNIALFTDIGNDLELPGISLYRLFDFHLNSTSMLQRSAVAMVIRDWASGYNQSFVKWKYLVEENQVTLGIPKMTIAESLWSALTVPPALYDELKYKMTDIDAVCRTYLSALLKEGVTTVRPMLTAMAVFTPEQAMEITSDTCRLVEPRLVTGFMNEKRLNAQKSIAEINSSMETMNRRLGLWLSAAILEAEHLPLKFNPIITPLMDVLKFETNSSLIGIAGRSLAIFLTLANSRQPCPNEKILKNLSTFLVQDTLSQLQDGCETEIVSMATLTEESGTKQLRSSHDSASKQSGIGAELAIREIVQYHREGITVFGGFLWDRMDLSKFCGLDEGSTRNLLTSLRLWSCIFSSLPESLRNKIFFDSIDCIALNNQRVLLECLASSSVILRHWAGRALAVCCVVDATATLNCIYGRVKDSFAAEHTKLGSIELVYLIVTSLGDAIVGLISLMTAPVMKCMAHSTASVRQLASITFGHLVTLMPLEDEKSIPARLSEQLKSIWRENFQFLSHLMHPTALSMTQLLFHLKGVELRGYQLEGISWISFLAQSGLHGILSDDMGLGKTLQTLCAIASSYASQRGSEPLPPSLIIAPNTVVNHWVNEVERYFGETEVLRPYANSGPKMDRNELQEVILGNGIHNVVVMSYETARREVKLLQLRHWHYCVLDEGHLIKNPKSQLFKALTAISSHHRLILTGTPIQNSVTELWSLFEFLMPGYLGTFSQFNTKFAKPIAASRDAKTSSKDAESGQKTLELLHKQVLPFVMRRQKEQVLKDLPPKIVQDYYCDLSWVQSRFYEDFSRQSTTIGDVGKQNVFQMLLYMRKLCDHPSLVFNPAHPGHVEIERELRSQGVSLMDLQCSGKMLAFGEILSECGIGRSDSKLQPFTPTHRALVFCQFKGMIDLVAQYIDSGQLSALIQSLGSDEGNSQCDLTPINYLRLDGSVPSHQRQSVAEKFNMDPDVDLLLLSTQVGGLGLNLTGADVVIFIDHDWNPTRDLQAMDRAHRLGQNRTVNVYRLITRGTLEEKIMRLQLFKTRVANTVVNEDNQSLVTMATDQIVDLLTLESTAKPTKPKGETTDLLRVSMFGQTASDAKTVSLDELWSTAEYDEAFNMDNYIQSIPQ